MTPFLLFKCPRLGWRHSGGDAFGIAGRLRFLELGVAFSFFRIGRFSRFGGLSLEPWPPVTEG